MLLRQTLLFLPAQTLVPLSQMTAAFLWTFWLGHEAMGTYAIIWSVQELIYLGVMSWWTTYCLRYASGVAGEGRADALDRTEMAVQLGGAALQSLAALLAVWIILPEQFTPGMLAATLAFTLTRNISTHFSTRSRAQLEALPYTINLLTGSAVGLGFGLIAVTHIAATPQALLYAYAIAQAMGLVMSAPFTKVTLRAPGIDMPIWRSAWGFGGPLMISSALSWAGNHAIRFIVEFGLGRAAVGLMTVGWWMGLRLATFVGLLMMGAAFNVAVERLRNEGRAAALQQLARNAAMLLGVLIPSVAGIWLIGSELVQHLVDESYREATAAILPIAMMAGAARAFREHGSDPAFLLFEKPHWPAYIAAIDAIATVTFCSLGLLLDGVVGAAWGCMFGAVAGAVASASIAVLNFGYRIECRDIGRILIATAAMAAPLMLLPAVLPFWAVLLAAAGGAAIYGGVLAALYPEPSMRVARSARSWLSRALKR